MSGKRLGRTDCGILWLGLWVPVVVLYAVTTVQAQGPIVTGIGPVNRAFGGAGTGAPLEAITALHWNPAAICALPSSQVSFGVESLLATVELGAEVGGSASRTSGEPGVAIIPSIGWVHHPENIPATVGLGIYGIAGFRNNMPADPTNPLLAGGPLFADAEIFQIAPTVAYPLTERLAFGLAPTVTAARLMFDPLGPSFITPAPTAGSGNRVHWGGGAQVGIFWRATDIWQWGFTIKSPQWFEDFRFHTPSGVVRSDIDYPMVLSLGTAFSGWPGWLIALDARYVDFKNTSGFRELGWSNVFAGAVGLQWDWSENLAWRFGYNFNQNPIKSGDAFTNLLTPLIQEQNISAGLSYRLAANVEVAAAYVYLVNNSLTGPLPSPPFGTGDTLTHKINAHSAVWGIIVSY